MKNIVITTVRENYIVVAADTERFGVGEILFEGNCFRECFDWVKRQTGKTSLSLRGWMSSLYTDRNGETFPTRIEVI